MDFSGTRSGGGRNLALLALPQSRIARIISRSLFLAVILLLIPHIGPEFKEQGKILWFNFANLHSPTAKEFNSLINDLEIADILQKGQKSLILIAGSNSKNLEAPAHYADHLRSMGGDVIIENNFWPQGSFADESFDIVFTLGQFGAGFVDRVLRIGGAVVVPAKDLSSNVFLDKLKYTCVYIKPYDVESVISVMVKPDPATDHSNGGNSAAVHRRPNWRHLNSYWLIFSTQWVEFFFFFLTEGN